MASTAFKHKDWHETCDKNLYLPQQKQALLDLYCSLFSSCQPKLKKRPQSIGDSADPTLEIDLQTWIIPQIRLHFNKYPLKEEEILMKIIPDAIDTVEHWCHEA